MPGFDGAMDQLEATEGDRYVDFEQFAVHVDPDPLRRVFASHLRRWREAAGASTPQ